MSNLIEKNKKIKPDFLTFTADDSFLVCHYLVKDNKKITDTILWAKRKNTNDIWFPIPEGCEYASMEYMEKLFNDFRRTYADKT